MTLSLTGSIQKKYEYSDYGQRSLDSKTEIINNEFGYNGEVHTVDGLQYLRARYYDPYTGVFISADSSYYINYGFCVKDIHKELQYPKPNECDISGRFLNEANKDVYNLDEMNSKEIVIDLEKNIHNFIVPVINEGINRYFEMFPHAICRATIKLKEYLRVN